MSGIKTGIAGKYSEIEPELNKKKEDKKDENS